VAWCGVLSKLSQAQRSPFCVCLCFAQGDYHRYLAEFKTGADRKEAAEHTLLAYKAAQVCFMREGGTAPLLHLCERQ